MKIFRSFLALSIAALAGCQTTPAISPAQGTVGGGLAGAGAGGIIGHQSGRGLEGAAIGGALGALSGAIIGLDRQARAQNPDHITLARVAEMSQQGVSSGEIINQMQRTDSRYTLSSESITYLKNNAVSDEVINYMLQTAPR